MKKVCLFVIVGMMVLSSHSVKAQLSVGLNINITQQPLWGPTGYDRVDYYYLPDIDLFYDVPNRQYIYSSNNQLIFSKSLPYQYRNYNLYKSYKVVVNDEKPYRHADEYRLRYAGFKGRHDQHIIRDSHESKYFEIKDHPKHHKWNDDKGMDRKLKQEKEYKKGRG